MYDLFLVNISSPADVESNLVESTLSDLDINADEQLYPIELCDPEANQVIAAGLATADARRSLEDANVRAEVLHHLRGLRDNANRDFDHTWAFHSSGISCVFYMTHR